MASKIWLSLVVGSITATSMAATIVPSASLAAGRKFDCATVDGVPTTVILKGSQRIPFIRWTSDAFLQSNYPAAKRCRDVSARFQRLYNSGNLKFITVGRLNRQPVVCGTTTPRGNCTSGNLLFTLKSASDGPRVMSQIEAIRRQANPGAQLEESAGNQLEDTSPMDWLEEN
jgi:hypothetical protein